MLENTPSQLMNQSIFIGLAFAFSLSWGKLLQILDERSPFITKLTFRLMEHSGLSFPEMKSVLLSFSYYSWCVLGSTFFASLYGLNLFEMLGFDLRYIPLVFLGIAGEISLSNILISLYLETRRTERSLVFTEISTIPWILGIRRLPPSLVLIVPAISALCEEFFFRGVLMPILLNKLHVLPWIALSLVTCLFILGQLLQVRTIPQAVVICCGSLAISLVGGLLVVHTGSVVPACLCHTSFVVFFMEYAGINRRKSVKGSRRSGEIYS